MRRRDFIVKTLTSSAGFIILPGWALSGSEWVGEPASGSGFDAAGFAAPPVAARPYTYWMWMNGNITKEGITLDLEAMQRGGIAGAYMYNCAVGIPRGPVDYGGEAWKDIVYHAVKEADRLGLVLSMHNSPGYSGTGGPWITPEWSMQELVWTETRVLGKSDGSGTQGGGVVLGGKGTGGAANGDLIVLSKPYAKQGYYRDAYVLAYPSLEVEGIGMENLLLKVSANGKEIDRKLILGVDLDKKIRIEPVNDTEPAALVMEFTLPYEARAITLYRHPETPKDLYDGDRDYPPTFRLESSDDGISYSPVCTLHCPPLRAMDSPAAQSFAAVTAVFFRLVTHSPTYIARIELHNGPRLPDWPAKTNYAGGNTQPSLTNEGFAASLAIDPAKVIDITDKMDAEGRLLWPAPVGKWTILRVGHTTTGEVVGAAPESGIGLECDKFRKEAVDFHFREFLDPLFRRLGPLVGKRLKSLLIDSWEAGKQNWSVDFPLEFRQRRQYDLVRWMPAMTGRIVGSPEETERFLWDVRKTHADLVAENYYGHFAALCHQRGLELHGEPYGDGTFDSLQAGAKLDLPMGEFWTRYIYGDAMTSRQASSLAHAYGRSVAASEAFTGMPITSRWTEYPYSLKAEADWFYTIGLNRLVFHTFVHQPFTTGLPGMTMGPFGTHFDRNSTWTPELSAWTQYLNRVQYLLQQKSRVVADACYFKGEAIGSGIPDQGRISPALPKGYAMDVIGADVVLNRLRIEGGQTVLPDGMSYRVMIMAPVRSISLPVLRKIRELVAGGMVLVINSRPDDTPGRADVGAVKEIVSELFGGLDGVAVTERVYGRGAIYWKKTLEEVFGGLRLAPDFTYTALKQDAVLHYIHKQMGDADLYFVTNHLRREENIVCSFRVVGRQPEIWEAGSGDIFEAAVFEIRDGRTILPLELSPAGSVFVIFRRKVAAGGGVSEVVKDGLSLFSTNAYPVKKGLYADVQNNFTIACWVKPDTYAHRGKSILIHAPAGEEIYGSGHTAAGLGAGQNVVRVYERDRGAAREVLVVDIILEGWTHIAVVYREGKPLLYINGGMAAEGRASGRVVHPGPGALATDEQYQSYFEGNSVAPEVYRESLTEEKIRGLVSAGLPAPELPLGCVIRQEAGGKRSLLAWEDGKYEMKAGGGVGSVGRVVDVSGVGRPVLVEGSWEVGFQAGRGAPASVLLPVLVSLHQHADPGVKYFSGTAIYKKRFFLPGGMWGEGHRVFLDLGRVEVIAAVRLNGHELGVVWKEPYRVEITGAAMAGENVLEVSVTNLWPNRLIGDEQLQEENEYSRHGPVLKFPEWYVNNKPKPGQRITFSAWHSYHKTDPLLASGLLGPVRVLGAVQKMLFVLVFLLVGFLNGRAQVPAAGEAIYQYSVPVGGRHAFLWIPPQCRRVRGLIFAAENALELNWMEDPIIRKTAAEEGLGMIWLADGKPTNITFEMKPDAIASLDTMFRDLAVESGYPEIENAPLIFTGHSWNGRMAWNYPNVRPERVLAAIPIRTYPMPDTLLFPGIPLLYIVGQTTELPEYSDGRPGDRDFFWPVVRRTALALRRQNEDNLIGVVVHPGGLHMDWSEDQSRFLALFIRKACKYRLPETGRGDEGKQDASGQERVGAVHLRAIDRRSGWLTDSGGMEPDRWAPAPYALYKGDPRAAYWFFDEETARAAVVFNGDRKKRQLQMPTFVRDGVKLPIARSGYVNYKFLPEADGVTFRMTGGFMDTIPAGLIGAGSPLGHANGAFTYRVTMGPGRQIGPDEFRVQFTRQKPRNVTIVVTQAGDVLYRKAKQPVIVEVPAKLTQGTAQSIDFRVLPDVVVGRKAIGLGANAIALGAKASSGLPVRYYVVAGPARVDGDSLRFTEIPVRSRYPIKITVVAYQWGRMTAPLFQSAEMVTREFYLMKREAKNFSVVDRTIRSWIDSGYYPGAALLVEKEGRTVYEKYFGSYRPGTVAYIASAGKWLAAATIAAVVDEGRLSWDDKVKKWLPEFTDVKGEATLRQLLSHTSGYPDYQPKGRRPDNYQTLRESVSHIAGLPADTVPGVVFHYGGLAMQVAGRMAELATGRDWETIFQEKIAGPLGMSSTHFTPVDETPGHNPMLGGGARTDLRGYVHFLEMIAGEGVYKGRRILSAAGIRVMQTDQVGAARVLPGEYVARSRGRMGTDIYGLGEWREEVDGSGEAVLISSPSWAGAYPWIDRKNKLIGFFLARVNVEKANARGFSAFYSSPILPMLVREAVGF